MREGELVDGLSEFDGGFWDARRSFSAISRPIDLDGVHLERNKSAWERG